MRTIVLYYSQSNMTRTVAQTLAEAIPADITEIKDLKNRNGFPNFLVSSIDAFRENKTQIDPAKIDLSEYDLVYIGSPTWANKPAPAIITLIDSLDLNGKDVILFSTESNAGGENSNRRMLEKVTARGARVISSFTIKTAKKESFEIRKNTLELISRLDLRLYSE